MSASQSFFFYVAFLASMSATSMMRGQEVYSQNKVIGRHFTSSTDIYGLVFTFSERIEHSFYDEKRDVISVLSRGVNSRDRLKNKGEILVYDLENATVKWSRNVRYFANSIFQPKGFLLENKGLKTTVSQIEDGSKLWKAPYETFFVAEEHQMAIGYDTQGSRNDNNVLEGFDLSTGKSMWNRSIPRKSGWNDIKQLNDSIYIVLASGLHTINARSGEGWSYFTKTGEKNTGNIVSNVLEDGDEYYLASKLKLACLNAASGQVKWSTSYPEELASSSAIFANDTAVFMLNTGIAFTWWGPVQYGEPFFAAYRKSTGHPYYLVQTAKPDEAILDHKDLKDHMLTLRIGTLESYNKKDGKLSASKNFEPEDIGYPMQFLPSREVFTKKPDGTYSSLQMQDSLHTFVLFNSGAVMAIDELLNRIYVLDVEALWIQFDERNGKVLVNDGERTMVIDGQGNVVAELLAPGGTLYNDDMFLFHRDVQTHLIDLKEVLAPHEP